MPELIVFFLVLISGSVFSAAFFSQRFEKTLPVTCMGIVFILFLSGVFGNLLPGFWAVLALSVLLWAAAGIRWFAGGRPAGFLQNLMTPGLLGFTLLYVALSILNHGKLACYWDDYSNWIDSVKAMTYLHDFTANPASRSLFRSYPPGMGLFQYFAQMIYQLFHPGVFCEGIVFEGYQLFSLSLLFPLTGKLRWNSPVRNVCVFLLLFLCPALFAENFYAQLVIDPFVGLLFGSATAYLFICGYRNNGDALFMGLVCFMLLLVKDVGKLFAVILLGTLAAVVLTGIRRKKTTLKKEAVRLAVPLVCAGLAYGLWQAVLAKYHTPISFGKAFDIPGFLKMFFLRSGSGWEQETVTRAQIALVQPRVSFGYLGVDMSYFAILLFASAGLFLLYRKKKERDPELGAGAAASVVSVCLQAVVYFVFISLVYITHFTPREAEGLSSFDRYMSTSVLPVWILLLFGTLQQLCPDDGDRTGKSGKMPFLRRFGCAGVACLVLLASPVGDLADFVTGETVRYSVGERQRYEELTRKIEAACTETDMIHVLSQGNDGGDCYALRCLVRPRRIVSPGSWSVGDGPLYEGDAFTVALTPGEFMNRLREEKCTHLAILRADDLFRTKYAELFDGEIRDNSVYRIDPETGKLVLCPDPAEE